MKKTKRLSIYTIGHSTRTIAELIQLLKEHDIQEIVDVRSIPRSRHNPQFNEKTVARSLQKNGLRYTHIKELGGLRHTSKGSKNLGWRNSSFRGFADYMSTPDFAKGLEFLEKIARKERTAIMCAEAVPWRCHRSMIADALVKHHWNVLDIVNIKTASKHRLTPFLKVRHGKLTYPIPRPQIRKLPKMEVTEIGSIGHENRKA